MYLFEDWLKCVCQMSFLPENTLKLEMMDKAFAEKHKKENEARELAQIVCFNPMLPRTKCIRVYLHFCISF